MRLMVIEIMARIRAEGYAQAAHMLSTGDIMADLVRLPGGLPIQIIVGQADGITPPASNLEIAANFPAASVHVIPGAGHALYLEKPEEFNRLVSDFAATHLVGRK
jgi:pimeloyl-ACP methyl ester carboxylesterase